MPFYAAFNSLQNPPVGCHPLHRASLRRSMAAKRRLEGVEVAEHGAFCESNMRCVRRAILTVLSVSSHPFPHKRGGGAWLLERIQTATPLFNELLPGMQARVPQRSASMKCIHGFVRRPSPTFDYQRALVMPLIFAAPRPRPVFKCTRVMKLCEHQSRHRLAKK